MNKHNRSKVLASFWNGIAKDCGMRRFDYVRKSTWSYVYRELGDKAGMFYYDGEVTPIIYRIPCEIPDVRIYISHDIYKARVRLMFHKSNSSKLYLYIYDMKRYAHHNDDWFMMLNERTLDEYGGD